MGSVFGKLNFEELKKIAGVAGWVALSSGLVAGVASVLQQLQNIELGQYGTLVLIPVLTVILKTTKDFFTDNSNNR